MFCLEKLVAEVLPERVSIQSHQQDRSRAQAIPVYIRGKDGKFFTRKLCVSLPINHLSEYFEQFAQHMLLK